MRSFVWPFLLVTFFFSGCESGSAVNGEATIGGKKLSGATITLVPEGEPNSAGISTEIRNGRFEFTPEQGVKRGKHKVIITPLPAPPDADPNNAPLQFKTFQAQVEVKSGTPLSFDVPN